MASLQPETIISVPGIDITNTLIATLFTDAILVLFLIVAIKNIQKVPGAFQTVIESGIEYFYSLTSQIAGKNTDKIFPWFMSFFIVIFVANLVGLLPGFGSIGFYETTTHAAPVTTDASHSKTPVKESSEHADDTAHGPTPDSHGEETIQPEEEHTEAPSEHATAPTEETHTETHFVPLLRGMTSDFNVTLALATISIVATHTIAVRTTGFKSYISRFLSLNPILLFVGILELVSEFTKLFSLSFRLFGNIYAGEVVLATISGLFAFLAPIPFLLLELIVALVQALVFAMLTMVFMSILATPHHADEH